MRVFPLALGVGLLSAASPLGALTLPSMTVDGEAIPVESFPCADVSLYQFGSATRCTGTDVAGASGTWTLESPALTFHEDISRVFLGGSFAIRNDTDQEQSFDVSISLPVTPGDVGGVEGVRIFGALTDLDADGALLTDVGVPVFQGRIDGNPSGAYALLLPPQSITAPASGSADLADGLFGYVVSRPQSSTEIELRFVLSAGDVVSFTDLGPPYNTPGVLFEVVPEPGTALLCALGLGALATRRARQCPCSIDVTEARCWSSLSSGGVPTKS